MHRAAAALTAHRMRLFADSQRQHAGPPMTFVAFVLIDGHGRISNFSITDELCARLSRAASIERILDRPARRVILRCARRISAETHRSQEMTTEIPDTAAIAAAPLELSDHALSIHHQAGHELREMWRNTRMVVLCVLSAALYAAVLV